MQLEAQAQAAEARAAKCESALQERDFHQARVIQLESQENDSRAAERPTSGT